MQSVPLLGRAEAVTRGSQRRKWQILSVGKADDGTKVKRRLSLNREMAQRRKISDTKTVEFAGSNIRVIEKKLFRPGSWQRVGIGQVMRIENWEKKRFSW